MRSSSGGGGGRQPDKRGMETSGDRQPSIQGVATVTACILGVSTAAVMLARSTEGSQDFSSSQNLSGVPISEATVANDGDDDDDDDDDAEAMMRKKEKAARSGVVAVSGRSGRGSEAPSGGFFAGIKNRIRSGVASLFGLVVPEIGANTPLGRLRGMNRSDPASLDVLMSTLRETGVADDPSMVAVFPPDVFMVALMSSGAVQSAVADVKNLVRSAVARGIRVDPSTGVASTGASVRVVHSAELSPTLLRDLFHTEAIQGPDLVLETMDDAIDRVETAVASAASGTRAELTLTVVWTATQFDSPHPWLRRLAAHTTDPDNEHVVLLVGPPLRSRSLSRLQSGGQASSFQLENVCPSLRVLRSQAPRHPLVSCVVLYTPSRDAASTFRSVFDQIRMRSCTSLTVLVPGREDEPTDAFVLEEAKFEVLAAYSNAIRARFGSVKPADPSRPDQLPTTGRSRGGEAESGSSSINVSVTYLRVGRSDAELAGCWSRLLEHIAGAWVCVLPSGATIAPSFVSNAERHGASKHAMAFPWTVMDTRGKPHRVMGVPTFSLSSLRRFPDVRPSPWWKGEVSWQQAARLDETPCHSRVDLVVAASAMMDHPRAGDNLIDPEDLWPERGIDLATALEIGSKMNVSKHWSMWHPMSSVMFDDHAYADLSPDLLGDQAPHLHGGASIPSRRLIAMAQHRYASSHGHAGGSGAGSVSRASTTRGSAASRAPTALQQAHRELGLDLTRMDEDAIRSLNTRVRDAQRRADVQWGATGKVTAPASTASRDAADHAIEGGASSVGVDSLTGPGSTVDNLVLGLIGNATDSLPPPSNVDEHDGRGEIVSGSGLPKELLGALPTHDSADAQSNNNGSGEDGDEDDDDQSVSVVRPDDSSDEGPASVPSRTKQLHDDSISSASHHQPHKAVGEETEETASHTTATQRSRRSTSSVAASVLSSLGSAMDSRNVGRRFRSSKGGTIFATPDSNVAAGTLKEMNWDTFREIVTNPSRQQPNDLKHEPTPQAAAAQCPSPSPLRDASQDTKPVATRSTISVPRRQAPEVAKDLGGAVPHPQAPRSIMSEPVLAMATGEAKEAAVAAVAAAAPETAAVAQRVVKAANPTPGFLGNGHGSGPASVKDALPPPDSTSSGTQRSYMAARAERSSLPSMPTCLRDMVARMHRYSALTGHKVAKRKRIRDLPGPREHVGSDDATSRLEGTNGRVDEARELCDAPTDIFEGSACQLIKTVCHLPPSSCASDPSKRLLVVTALFGGRDTLKDAPTSVVDGVRCICFTDDATTLIGRKNGWEIQELPQSVVRTIRDTSTRSQQNLPRRMARFCKTQLHKLVPDSEFPFRMWVDATVSFQYRAIDVFRNFLPTLRTLSPGLWEDATDATAFASGTPPIIGCKSHPDQKSLAGEFERVRELKMDTDELFVDQMAQYRDAGFDLDLTDVFETPILAWINSEVTRGLFDAWYEQIRTMSCRDQVGFPWALACVGASSRVHVEPRKLRIHHFTDPRVVPVTIHGHDA